MVVLFNIFAFALAASIIVAGIWLCWPRRPNPNEVRTLPDGTVGRASDYPQRLGSSPSEQGTDHPYMPDFSGGLYSEWDGTLFGWFFTLIANILILIAPPVLLCLVVFLMLAID